MLTAGGQHYCGENHLNINLSQDEIEKSLFWFLSAEASHPLSLDEVLRPLSANQKILLGMLSEGLSLREATNRLHYNIKSLYHLRRQSCQRLGIKALSEVHRFMGFYWFMVYHERRYVTVRTISGSRYNLAEGSVSTGTSASGGNYDIPDDDDFILLRNNVNA